MDILNIKKLIRLVESSQINELEIQQEGLQVRIVKNAASGAPMLSPQIVHAVPSVALPAGAASQVPDNRGDSIHSGIHENTIEIRSPMVGTFYRAPAPEAAAFVSEGDVIKPGQIVCIIEAMKLMNEIEAEISGKIVKILAKNAQPVEYNQPLFLVEKG